MLCRDTEAVMRLKTFVRVIEHVYRHDRGCAWRRRWRPPFWECWLPPSPRFGYRRGERDTRRYLACRVSGIA